jgi:hypothetical protein
LESIQHPIFPYFIILPFFNLAFLLYTIPVGKNIIRICANHSTVPGQAICGDSFPVFKKYPFLLRFQLKMAPKKFFVASALMAAICLVSLRPDNVDAAPVGRTSTIDDDWESITMPYTATRSTEVPEPTEEVSQTAGAESTEVSTEEATQTTEEVPEPTEEVTQSAGAESTEECTEEATQTAGAESTEGSTEEPTQTTEEAAQITEESSQTAGAESTQVCTEEATETAAAESTEVFTVEPTQTTEDVTQTAGAESTSAGPVETECADDDDADVVAETPQAAFSYDNETKQTVTGNDIKKCYTLDGKYGILSLKVTPAKCGLHLYFGKDCKGAHTPKRSKYQSSVAWKVHGKTFYPKSFKFVC